MHGARSCPHRLVGENPEPSCLPRLFWGYRHASNTDKRCLERLLLAEVWDSSESALRRRWVAPVCMRRESPDSRAVRRGTVTAALSLQATLGVFRQRDFERRQHAQLLGAIPASCAPCASAKGRRRVGRVWNFHADSPSGRGLEAFYCDATPAGVSLTTKRVEGCVFGAPL